MGMVFFTGHPFNDGCKMVHDTAGYFQGYCVIHEQNVAVRGNETFGLGKYLVAQESWFFMQGHGDDRKIEMVGWQSCPGGIGKDEGHSGTIFMSGLAEHARGEINARDLKTLFSHVSGQGSCAAAQIDHCPCPDLSGQGACLSVFGQKQGSYEQIIERGDGLVFGGRIMELVHRRFVADICCRFVGAYRLVALCWITVSGDQPVAPTEFLMKIIYILNDY